MSIDLLTFLQQHGIQRDPRGAFDENLDLPGSAPEPEPMARGRAVPVERAPVSERVALAEAPGESPAPSPARAVARAEPVAVAPPPQREPPTPDPFRIAKSFQNAANTAAKDPEFFKAMQPRLQQMRDEAAGIHAANFQGDPMADPAGYAQHMGTLDAHFGKPMGAKEVAYWQKWQAGDKAERIARAEEALQKGDLATLKDNIDDLLGEGITAVDIQTGKATIGGVEVPSHVIMLQGPDGKPLPPINSVEWLAQRASLETRVNLAKAQQQADDAKRQEPTKRMQEQNAELEAKQKNQVLTQDPEAVALKKKLDDFATFRRDILKATKGNPEAVKGAQMAIVQEAKRMGLPESVYLSPEFQGGGGAGGAETTEPPLPSNDGPVMPGSVAEARATSRQQAEQERLRSLSPLEQERELAATAQARTRTQEETARRQAGFDQELQEIGIQAPAIKSIPELREKALARLNEIAQQDPTRAATARAIMKAILAPSQPMRPLPWQTPADTVRAMPVTP